MAMKNELIRNLLKRRGLNLTRLAALAGVSRTHLSEALAGKPGRGGINRRKIACHLTAEERAFLGWSADERMEKSVPHGTAFHVERIKAM